VKAGVAGILSDHTEGRKDEWSYLSTAFQHTLDQVHLMSRNQDDQNTILRTYYRKKIVLESAAMPHEEIQELTRQYELNLSEDRPFLLVGFHVDSYNQSNGAAAAATNIASQA